MIANQCSNDELFLCFYRELRNRHMFATTNVSKRTPGGRAGGRAAQWGHVMTEWLPIVGFRGCLPCQRASWTKPGVDRRMWWGAWGDRAPQKKWQFYCCRWGW